MRLSIASQAEHDPIWPEVSIAQSGRCFFLFSTTVFTFVEQSVGLSLLLGIPDKLGLELAE